MVGVARRHAWIIDAIGVAAAVLVLQAIEIHYVASFFGNTWGTGSASLIHPQAGLLLAVALLCRDRRILAVAFLAILIGWFVRVAWLGQLDLMTWQRALVVTVGMALRLFWTELCARWMGAPFTDERPFDTRHLPSFIAIGLVLYPLGWALLTVLSNLIQGYDYILWSNEAVQQFLAKHVGVACITLPLLLFWIDGHAGVTPRRRFAHAGVWAGVLLLVAQLLGPTVIDGADAWLVWLYEYRLTVGAVLAAAVLLLSPAWSMPLLLIVHFALLHVLVANAYGSRDIGEIGSLLAHVAELNWMAVLLAGLYLVSRGRREAYVRLKQAAYHDATTGLSNANALRDAWSRRRVVPDQIGFLVFDHSDKLIGSYGWPAQIELLRDVSRTLAPFGPSYYLGGAHFVLLPANDDVNAPDHWNEVLATLHRQVFAWRGVTLHATPYLGLASPRSLSNEHLDDSVTDACEAAVQARQRGESDPVLASGDSGNGESIDARRQRFRIVGEAIDRIRSRQIELHLQPIERIDGRPAQPGIRGEILCRLRTPEGRLIPPDDFIPALEANGHVAELDLAVVEALFDYLRAHPAFVASVARLGINLSGVSLSSDSFRTRLATLLRNAPMSPEKLCFELTETAVISRFEPAMKLFMELRALGCRMALDDFGSGVQNFERMRQLPVDGIKIDGQFVRNINKQGSDLEIVRAAVAVAQAHGMETIAEYVEDSGVDTRLRELGVNWGQGFLYARPLPLEEVALI